MQWDDKTIFADFSQYLESALANQHTQIELQTTLFYCTDHAKSKLALDVPVYTIWSACVNFAFDSVYHKLD